MRSASRRWVAGALLVGAGWLVTPHPVPVYDGIGAPDEPYRYVTPPEGTTQTAGPTAALAQTPVKAGRGTNGLSLVTMEMGPQFSIFLPPMSMAAAGTTIEVRAEPQEPSTQPAGARIDGNVYLVTLSSSGGPVTLTEKSAISTVYMRATTAKQPPPSIYHRSDADAPWKALKTSRGGQDFYVAAFPGAGSFAVAFADVATKGSSLPVLPIALGAVLLLLVVVVLVVRLRSSEE